MYMLGGKLDKTRYTENKKETKRTSLTLTEEDIQYLEEKGTDRSSTARRILKNIRENPELQKKVL